MNKRHTSTVSRLSKKSYAVFGVIILALVVVHFGVQLTFIANERWRIAEPSVTVAAVDQAPTQLTPLVAEESVATESVADRTKRPDVIFDPRQKTDKPADKEKAQRVMHTASSQREAAKTATRPERLRDAERLLTGF